MSSSRMPRVWVLADTVNEARAGLTARDIPYAASLPWSGRVKVVTRRSERRTRGARAVRGDRVLQLPGAHQSTVEAFELVLVAGNVTYADLEILS